VRVRAAPCCALDVPEGDALHRAAARLRVLEGEVIAAEAPHPRAALLGVAEKIDGRRLERVEAVGKNLLQTFEGGVVLRSHLRMRGRWHVQQAGGRIVGMPWLILRGGSWEALQRNGPVLELSGRAVARLGPDIMADPPDLNAMVSRLRATDQTREVGEALLDQRLVAGIGNLWRAEALFETSTSPWLSLNDVSDQELRSVLSAASTLMRVPRKRRSVYRRAGLPCRRCGTRIGSRAQGENARIAYWCPSCQRGTEAAEA
jgi:endonuclease VIII